MGLHNEEKELEQEFFEMGQDFPEVPETIHAVVMDTLENLDHEEILHGNEGGNGMKIKKRRIVCAAAVLAAMFGTTVAAAELFQWNEKAVESFNNPPQEIQNEMAANNVAEEQTDSATNQGITVSAVQTIQDENRVYILLKVEAEDAIIDSNSFFDIWKVGTSDTEAFWNLGAGFAQGTGVEKSNQGYYEINALKDPDREWKEDCIELELGEFGYYTYEESTAGTAHMVGGSWKLTIPLGEQTEALTRVYEPGQQVMVSGYPVTLKEVKLSPISAVLSFDLKEEQEMIEHVYPDEQDVFAYDLQLRGFVYEDGEKVACSNNGSSTYWDTEADSDVQQIALSTVISPEKVTAVLLGRAETPLEECTQIELK